MFNFSPADSSDIHPLIKLEDNDGATPMQNLNHLLNPLDMILARTTIVLQGKRTITLAGCPVLDIAALWQSWLQDVQFDKPFFRGLSVTCAAYRDVPLAPSESTASQPKVNLSITFATITQATAAWLMLPVWLPFTGLDNVEFISTNNVGSACHPLLQISGDATGLLLRQPWQLQQAFVHPSLPSMAELVLPLAFEVSNMQFCLAFASPKEAALMLGKMPLLSGDGMFPYTNHKYSTALELHSVVSPVQQCARCGQLGHLESICTVRRHFGDKCAMCSIDSKLSHPANEGCPVRASLDENSLKIADHARRAAEITGIFSLSTKPILDKVQASL